MSTVTINDTVSTSAVTINETTQEVTIAVSTSLQPGDNANLLGSGNATDGYVLTADGAGGIAWEAGGGGASSWDALTGTANHIPMAPAPTGVPTTEGTLSWNATDHTLNLQTEIEAVAIQVGQESLIPFHNDTGGQLADGTCVAITGSTGERMTVTKAIATNATHAVSVVGLVTSDVANGANGYVNIFGRVRDVQTNQYSGAEGSVLYVSPTTAGELTSTKPTGENWAIRVGWIEKKAGAGAGRILVSCARLSANYDELIGKPSTFAPSSHAASHAAAGDDPVSISATQISNSTAAGRAVLTATDATAQELLGLGMYRKAVTGGNAWVGGDQTGNARGVNALDVQSYRSGVTRVASDQNSICVGIDCLSSGEYSTVIGNGVTNTIDSCGEFGLHSIGSRLFGVRGYSEGTAGYISISCLTSSTAYTDGGDTPGSESFGTVARDSVAFRLSEAVFYADFNDSSGTVTTHILTASSTFASGSPIAWASTADATMVNAGAGTTGLAIFKSATPSAVNTAMGTICKIKASPTSRQSTTTYTVDSDFTIAVAANERVRVDFQISYSPPSSGNYGFKMRFVLPSAHAKTPTWVGYGMQNSTFVALQYASSGSIVGEAALTSTANDTGALPRVMTGWFEATIGSSGGNITLEWAQAASGAVNTTVEAQSCVVKTTRSAN